MKVVILDITDSSMTLTHLAALASCADMQIAQREPQVMELKNLDSMLGDFQPLPTQEREPWRRGRPLRK